MSVLIKLTYKIEKKFQTAIVLAIISEKSVNIKYNMTNSHDIEEYYKVAEELVLKAGKVLTRICYN